MYKVTALLESDAPYQQRRQIFIPKLEREAAEAYEERTWRETAHYNPDGFLYIPGPQFKKAFENIALYSKDPMPGKKGSTYYQPAMSATTCLESPVTEYTRETVIGTPVSVPSDGKKGGGKRVVRFFPTVPQWKGETTWLIYDEIITPEIFERYLRLAGLLVGVGVWAPRKGGMYGRFNVLKFATEKMG